MRVYEIKVNGKKYKVEVMGITEVTPTVVKSETKAVAAANAPAPTNTAASAPAAATDGKGTEVVAPMQGTILDIKVSVGKEVKAGDTVAILEAMKLENEIKTPVAGKVIAIKVNKGQSVNNKDVLVVIG